MIIRTIKNKRKKRIKMLIQFRKKKKKRTETVEEIIPKWNKEITG